MEIAGKVVQIQDPVTGTSNKGQWKKQEIILEMPGKFSPKLAITNWNDKVDIAGLSVGSNGKFTVNIESREYNGRWFTEVKMWKMELDASAESTVGDEPISFSLDEESDPFKGDPEDDLPF